MSDDLSDTKNHPSYGFIRMNRVNGGTGRLFMSPLRHDHRISIEIGPACYERSLSCDGHRAEGQAVIRIEMSDEQFARFITSQGTHSGTPCTITRLNGECIASPEGEIKSERWYAEMRATAEQAAKDIATLRADLAPLLEKMPKGARAEFNQRLGAFEQKICDHLPWIVQAMHEGLDKVKNTALIEFEAYVNRRLAEAQAAGTPIEGATPVLALEAHVEPASSGDGS